MVRNRSFTVPQSVVSMYQLEEYARPMVGRSVQVNSLCFTKRDWKANVVSEAKAHLLVFTPDAKECSVLSGQTCPLLISANTRLTLLVLTIKVSCKAEDR